MDTSETYIKMRRMAIPFLGMGNPPRFSCGSEVSWRTTFVCTDLKGDFYYSSKDETFQLERQDQLQEMVIAQDLCGYKIVSPNKPPLVDNLLAAFEFFCRKQSWMGRADGMDKRPTMEQLWLAFVMKEKFSKTWNGEDWI